MLVETTQRREESLMAMAAVLQVLWPSRLLPIPDDLSKTNLRSPQRRFAVANPAYHAPEWLGSQSRAEMLQGP